MSSCSDHRKSALFAALSAIPRGRVTSYGALARQAGVPGGARWVGYTLGQLPDDSNLPWHRVVNARGEISLPPGSCGYTEQINRLRQEGIEVREGRVNLRLFGH